MPKEITLRKLLLKIQKILKYCGKMLKNLYILKVQQNNAPFFTIFW